MYGFFDIVKIVRRMASFWAFFLWKIRTPILYLHKFISIFLKSDTYFVRFIHYKQENIFLHQELLQLCCKPRSLLRMDFSNHPSQKFIKFKRVFSCNEK